MRYLRYLLEHLGITTRPRSTRSPAGAATTTVPVGLWNLRRSRGGAPPSTACARAGLVAGVISNSNGSVRSILAATGLAEPLDFVIDSSVVGVEKPDPPHLRPGAARGGRSRGQAVYVGDLYSVDVLGARGAGLDAILLDPRGFWARATATCPGLNEAVTLLLGE